MKLLVIYHSGLAEDIKNIFREYVRQGIDLTVIVPQIHGPLVWGEHHQKEAFTYIPLKLKAGYNIVKLFFAIKKAKPDAIHVFDEYHNFALFQTVLCRNILYGRKVPVFCLAFQNIESFYKSPPLVFKSLVQFLKRALLKIAYPAIISFHNRYLDGVVAAGNSEVIRHIRNVGGQMPIEKIFWGVNFKAFYAKDKAAARNALGIPRDMKLVGYVGKIIKAKGVDTALKAVASLPGYHLALLGFGEYKEERAQMESLVDSLKIRDRVHFYDGVPSKNLVDYYNAFDVLVVPSITTPQWKEQYGRVLVEGMAAHVPIVASSSGSIPEVLEGYPKHLIFKEGDHKELAEKIVLAEKMEIPANFNVENFMRQYSLENFIQKTIIFYDETLSKIR